MIYFGKMSIRLRENDLREPILHTLGDISQRIVPATGRFSVH